MPPQNISDILISARLRIVLDSPVFCSGTEAGMPLQSRVPSSRSRFTLARA